MRLSLDGYHSSNAVQKPEAHESGVGGGALVRDSHSDQGREVPNDQVLRPLSGG
jgi:hypothetical protein